jgi:hypothetical protein
LLEESCEDEDIVMTLHKSLPASYEKLIIVLEKMPMKDLTMKYMTVRFMHEISKHKEKKAQGIDKAMVL